MYALGGEKVFLMILLSGFNIYYLSNKKKFCKFREFFFCDIVTNAFLVFLLLTGKK